MADEKLKKLIAFVIDQVRDAGGSLPKTKLVKLLYLIDVSGMRHLDKPMTGIRWKYWHYGPYSEEIETAIRGIVGRSVDELEVITKDGRRILTYQAVEPEEIEQVYGLEERLVIYNILNEWAVEELKDILNYVYFETEPMAEAEWGHLLNLGLVRRSKDEQRWAPQNIIANLPESKLIEFRKRLREAALEAESRQVPPPAYDAVFFAGAKLADAEDRKSLRHLIGSKGVISPKGNVNET